MFVIVLKAWPEVCLLDRRGQKFAPRHPPASVSGNKKKAITGDVPRHDQVAAKRAAEEKRLVDYILQSTGAEHHLVVLCSHTIQNHSRALFCCFCFG